MSTLPIYPNDPLSTGNTILTGLGTFWRSYFDDRDKLMTLYGAEATLARQTDNDYETAKLCASRFTCPTHKRLEWMQLSILESTLRADSLSYPKYNDGDSYTAELTYDQPDGMLGCELDIADSIVWITSLMDHMANPSLFLVGGTDFTVTNGMLVFTQNPFDNAAAVPVNVCDSDGTVLDRSLTLWAYATMYDLEYLYEHYGYLLPSRPVSSDSYRNLINGAWNGYVGGLSTKDLEQFLAALAGIEVVKSDGELVDAVLVTVDSTTIITDKTVYKFPAGSIPIVDVGDELLAGDQLVNTVRVFDLASRYDVARLLTDVLTTSAGDLVPRLAYDRSSVVLTVTDTGSAESASQMFPTRGYMPAIYGIPVPQAVLGSGYKGGLYFINDYSTYDKSDLDINSRIVGKIVDVVGHNDDVAKFWDTAHTAGVAAGTTWLEALNPGNGAYVNPAGFVIDQFLGCNGVIAVLNCSYFGSEAQSLNIISELRKLLPPEKILLVITEWDVTADTMALAEGTTAQVSTSQPTGESATIGDIDASAYTITVCD